MEPTAVRYARNLRMALHLESPAENLSGVTRTFAVVATLWVIEHLSGSLIGTQSAADLVDPNQKSPRQERA